MPSKTEVFTPCCTLPEKVQALCCGCTSYTWQWWEITDVDQFSDGACSGTDLSGNPFVVHPTGRCGLNTTSALRFLGPSPAIGAWSPQQLKCNWMSWPYVFEIFGGGGDPYYGGHGSPPTSEFMGLCYLIPFGGIGGPGAEKRVGWQMGCEPASSATTVPALIEWTSPDCTECGDGLYCDDSHDIEYGSLEDCQTYSPNPEQCKCCGEPEPQYFPTEQDCINFGCTSCHPVTIYPALYTPPFPSLWWLTLSQ